MHQNIVRFLSTAALASLCTGLARSASNCRSRLKNWTAAEDHRNMMEQLGIKALRPGPQRQ